MTNKKEFIPKFKKGDTVIRTSEGEWFGLRQWDSGVIKEVRPLPHLNWSQIIIEGYDGIYSDFNFKIVKVNK